MAIELRKEVISYITEGTVIDHIPPGEALTIIRLLNLDNYQKRLSIGINLPSTSYGLKDLIKIEEKELEEKEVNQVALFAPDATISIIRDRKVHLKFQVILPEKIEGCFKCPNAHCITNHERVTHVFTLSERGQKIFFCCKYCRKTFTH